MRWKSRINNYNEFEQHMLDSGVKLTVVECTYGKLPYELKNNKHIKHIGVRSNSILWNKENLINIGITRLPETAKYIGWFDSDLYFQNKYWVYDTINALQQYSVIQPWEDVQDLGPNGEILNFKPTKSFMCQVFNNQQLIPMGENGKIKPAIYPHPGYAWCMTREALNHTGMLLDKCILGSADRHMAYSFANIADKSFPDKIHPEYKRLVLQWQDRVNKHIKGNGGYISGTIDHKFHGKKEDRQYVDRWKIIVNHEYDPSTDIKTNTHGVYEFIGNKRQMEIDIDNYFHNRKEDAESL